MNRGTRVFGAMSGRRDKFVQAARANANRPEFSAERVLADYDRKLGLIRDIRESGERKPWRTRAA